MTATAESRVRFGLELACDCRPGTCAYPEADCVRASYNDEPQASSLTAVALIDPWAAPGDETDDDVPF